MRSNFGLPSYRSDGDLEFPWFSDDDGPPTGSDTSKARDKAEDGGGSEEGAKDGAQGVENAEDTGMMLLMALTP